MLVGLSGGGHGGIRSAPPPVCSPCAYTTAQFLDYVNFLTFAIHEFRMPRLSNNPTSPRTVDGTFLQTPPHPFHSFPHSVRFE